jgi:hypothetical protein
MTFQIALYEYDEIKEQCNYLPFVFLKPTKIWDNFITEFIPSSGQDWFAAREKYLKEKYNAYISYETKIAHLVFEREKDMILFLLRWS